MSNPLFSHISEDGKTDRTELHDVTLYRKIEEKYVPIIDKILLETDSFVLNDYLEDSGELLNIGFNSFTQAEYIFGMLLFRHYPNYRCNIGFKSGPDIEMGVEFFRKIEK